MLRLPRYLADPLLPLVVLPVACGLCLVLSLAVPLVFLFALVEPTVLFPSLHLVVPSLRCLFLFSTCPPPLLRQLLLMLMFWWSTRLEGYLDVLRELSDRDWAGSLQWVARLFCGQVPDDLPMRLDFLCRVPFGPTARP